VPEITIGAVSPVVAISIIVVLAILLGAKDEEPHFTSGEWHRHIFFDSWILTSKD
jgi:hypothetical protein